jgi:hypothetical protein
MTKLIDLASTIRSKNAGVNQITFDIIFSDPAKYQRVLKSKAITKESVAKLFRIPCRASRTSSPSVPLTQSSSRSTGCGRAAARAIGTSSVASSTVRCSKWKFRIKAPARLSRVSRRAPFGRCRRRCWLPPTASRTIRVLRAELMVRTRFAPSPTGYLHIGGARTALFCWAYAKKHGGTFILRVEDTDLERSTRQSVQAILDGMKWLGLDCDEGPFFQMKRLQRYKEAAQQLLAAGHAYHCYCSKEELEAMREAQRARGEKPRYDGRWRDSKEAPPAGVTPVLRFKTPLSGDVTWDDQVKGPITCQQRGTRRSCDSARGRRAHLQLRCRGRRCRHGHHARDPRRRPRKQHAAPDQHLQGARRDAAEIRAPCR